MTYNPQHDGAQQFFESYVEFDADNNFTVFGHSYLKGVTDDHPINKTLFDKDEYWISPWTTYSNVTKLSISIKGYVGPFGGHSFGALYYRSESNPDWTKWGSYNICHGVVRKFTTSNLPPGKYKIVRLLKRGGLFVAEDNLFPVIDLDPKWRYLIPHIEKNSIN